MAYRLTDSPGGLLRKGDQLQVEIQAPEAGFLYAFDEAALPAQNAARFTHLFPGFNTAESPTTLAAPFQRIPQSPAAWLDYDGESLRESVWVVWSTHPIPELEATRAYALPPDYGAIPSYAAQPLERWLADHTAVQATDPLVSRLPLPVPKPITASLAGLARMPSVSVGNLTWLIHPRYREPLENPLEETHDVTRLLGLAQQGDAAARGALLERCYRELYGIARRQASRERKHNTLQATALLHEAYLRLFGGDNLQWQNRAHFFAIASRLMRQVLVDYARNRGAEKRGGDVIQFSLDEGDGARDFQPDELLTVHVALEQLEQFDPHLARLVECKYFAGMTDDEIAEALNLSFAQVRRDWSFARTWLKSKLE